MSPINPSVWTPPDGPCGLQRNDSGYTTAGLMSQCYSRMLYGHAARFNPPVLEGPMRAGCGAIWGCTRCTDDGECTPSAPSGLRYNESTFSPRVGRWSDLARAEVHMFDSNRFTTFHWAIADVNVSSSTIMFGRGGFQAVQGSHEGAEWYVSGIREELTAPGEWYASQADDGSGTLWVCHCSLPFVCTSPSLWLSWQL